MHRAALDEAAPTAWPDDDVDAPQAMLFSTSGRISRRRFWLWGVLALLGLGLLLQGLLGVARVRAGTAEHIVNLLLLWPAAAISIKRLHDTDRSGWWVLLALVPLLGWLWLLVVNGVLPGSRDSNRFGPAPRV